MKKRSSLLRDSLKFCHLFIYLFYLFLFSDIRFRQMNWSAGGSCTQPNKETLGRKVTKLFFVVTDPGEK
jgi:hypothetical protein